MPLGLQYLNLIPPQNNQYIYGILINWGAFNGDIGITLRISSGFETKDIKLKYFDARPWDLMLGFKITNYITKSFVGCTLRISIPNISDNSHFFDPNQNARLEIAGVMWCPDLFGEESGNLNEISYDPINSLIIPNIHLISVESKNEMVNFLQSNAP